MLICRRSSGGVCRLLASGADFVSVCQTFVLGGQTTQWRCASRGSLPRAVQPTVRRPVDAAGLLVAFAECATSRRRSTKLAGRKWTAATRVQKPKPRPHGLRSSSCKLRQAAPHIVLEPADARLRSGEAGFLECYKPGRVRQRNQRCGSTFCRWLSPAWC